MLIKTVITLLLSLFAYGINAGPGLSKLVADGQEDEDKQPSRIVLQFLDRYPSKRFLVTDAEIIELPSIRTRTMQLIRVYVGDSADGFLIFTDQQTAEAVKNHIKEIHGHGKLYEVAIQLTELAWANVLEDYHVKEAVFTIRHISNPDKLSVILKIKNRMNRNQIIYKSMI